MNDLIPVAIITVPILIVAVTVWYEIRKDRTTERRIERGLQFHRSQRMQRSGSDQTPPTSSHDDDFWNGFAARNALLQSDEINTGSHHHDSSSSDPIASYDGGTPDCSSSDSGSDSSSSCDSGTSS